MTYSVHMDNKFIALVKLYSLFFSFYNTQYVPISHICGLEFFSFQFCRFSIRWWIMHMKTTWNVLGFLQRNSLHLNWLLVLLWDTHAWIHFVWNPIKSFLCYIIWISTLFSLSIIQFPICPHDHQWLILFILTTTLLHLELYTAILFSF